MALQGRPRHPRRHGEEIGAEVTERQQQQAKKKKRKEKGGRKKGEGRIRKKSRGREGRGEEGRGRMVEG